MQNGGKVAKHSYFGFAQQKSLFIIHSALFIFPNICGYYFHLPRIDLPPQMYMRRNYPCGYYRRGYNMSRGGRIAIAHNEFPIEYWIFKFGLPEDSAIPMLIYMGIHHPGPYGDETNFWRLPDKDDPEELQRIFRFFHAVPAKEIKFIQFMAEHLQKSISDKNKILKKSERPRKWKRRKKNYKRRGYSKKRARKGLEHRDWTG
jgi:hypothetical protein